MLRFHQPRFGNIFYYPDEGRLRAVVEACIEDAITPRLAGILRQQVPDAVKRRKATMVIPTGLGLAPTRLALAKAVRRLVTRRGRAWPPNPWRDRFTGQLARARRK